MTARSVGRIDEIDVLPLDLSAHRNEDGRLWGKYEPCLALKMLVLQSSARPRKCAPLQASIPINCTSKFAVNANSCPNPPSEIKLHY
jgi:hypothetical protein